MGRPFGTVASEPVAVAGVPSAAGPSVAETDAVVEQVVEPDWASVAAAAAAVMEDELLLQAEAGGVLGKSGTPRLEEALEAVEAEVDLVAAADAAAESMPGQPLVLVATVRVAGAPVVEMTAAAAARDWTGSSVTALARTPAKASAPVGGVAAR